ncbi:MAG: VCBS repeat-containing protein, partial [Pyrinomonadaceae bacterium]|nr:VCBS repeat-containing protein [Pyrinomonadaceae bacterium]
MKSKLTRSPAKFVRGRNRRRSARVVALSLTLTALFMAALTLGPRGSRAQSAGPAPDYSKVDDFTNGATHLLRNDDLVMTFNYVNANSETRNVLFSSGTTDSKPAFLDYLDPQVPGGVAGCASASTSSCYLDVRALSGQKPVIGRFFNTAKDTTVLLPVQFTTSAKRYLVVMDGKTDGSKPPTAGLQFASAQDIADWAAGYDLFLTAIGDFNGDGYDDLLIGASITSRFPSFPRLFLATATDVNFPSKGFTIKSSAAGYDGAAIRELAVGDFDGDHLPEIAYLSVGQNAGLSLHTYQVDPKTFSISYGGSVNLYQLANANVTTALTMTAGKFTPKPNQQLAVGFHIGSGQNLEVQIVDFDPGSAQPKLMTTWDVPDASTDPVLKLKAGRFNWAGPYDQIAWMSSTYGPGTRLEILAVDPASLTITQKANVVFSSDPDSNATFFGRDIAIGNFDHQQIDFTKPAVERNPNLQIALIGLRINRTNNQIGTAGVAILDVSEDFSTITTSSYSVLNEAYFGSNSLAEMTITAGDLQGRSFRLGASYKVTVDHVQPSVVLATPPMHADYISPGLGKLAAVLNFSLAPDGFSSKYEQTESTDATVKHTATTSSSFSGEEKISGSFAFGEAGADGEIESGVEIKDSFTAKQDIKDSTDTINGAFNSQEFEISQSTGLSDVVWFKDTSFYLYVYPVIGQRICRADKLDKNGKCADTDKVPMQVMFSAPKQTTVQRLASDTLEWYQPPWEYGNILSYPGSYSQLQQIVPDINLLSAEP